MGNIPQANRFDAPVAAFDPTAALLVVDQNLGNFGDHFRHQIEAANDAGTADQNLIGHFAIMKARQVIRAAAAEAWIRGRA